MSLSPRTKELSLDPGLTWGWKLYWGEASFLSVTWSRICSKKPPMMGPPSFVDGWNPANQLRLVVYPIIYRVSCIPGGVGFQPSTVCPLPIPFSYFKRFGNGSSMGMVVPLLGVPRISLDPGHQCIKTKAYRRWTSYPPSNQNVAPENRTVGVDDNFLFGANLAYFQGRTCC